MSEELIQYAQKCAWCNDYLYITDRTAIYNGPDTRLRSWTCHERCNLPPSPRPHKRRRVTK